MSTIKINPNQVAKMLVGKTLVCKTPEEIEIVMGYEVCPCCGRKTRPKYNFRLFCSGYYPQFLTNEQLVKMFPSLRFASIKQKVEHLKQQPYYFMSIDE